MIHLSLSIICKKKFQCPSISYIYEEALNMLVKEAQHFAVAALTIDVSHVVLRRFAFFAALYESYLMKPLFISRFSVQCAGRHRSPLGRRVNVHCLRL